MFKENEKAYIKNKCDFYTTAIENGAYEDLVRQKTAKQIYYYTIKDKFITEGYEPDEEGFENGDEADSYTKDQIIEALKNETECNEKIIEEIEKKWATYQEDIAEVTNFNHIKFGTELEYGGRGGWTNMETYENIIQDEKSDGSVSGSGREYNLKPFDLNNVNTKIKQEIEKFMKEIINKHNCTEHISAGEHIHYSADELGPRHGRIIQDTINELQTRYGLYDWSRYFRKDPKESQHIKMLETQIGNERDILRKDAYEQDKERQIKIYEAYQFLYSVSNRAGTESYGLGRDCTRGYTCHRTIELRVWRTTLDFRAVFARATIGWFWLQWMIEKETLNTRGYIDWKMESIWTKLQEKPSYAQKSINLIKYMYLAFHVKNQHRVGLSKEDLIIKLGCTKATAAAIKARSNMFAKQLRLGSGEAEAKEIFNAIY